MAKGLVINVANPEGDREVERSQEPCVVLDDGTPVFEVWYWHCDLKRWFVMTNEPGDPSLIGTIAFRPSQIPALPKMFEEQED